MVVYFLRAVCVLMIQKVYLWQTCKFCCLRVLPLTSHAKTPVCGLDMFTCLMRFYILPIWIFIADFSFRAGFALMHALGRSEGEQTKYCFSVLYIALLPSVPDFLLAFRNSLSRAIFVLALARWSVLQALFVHFQVWQLNTIVTASKEKLE